MDTKDIFNKLARGSTFNMHQKVENSRHNESSESSKKHNLYVGPSSKIKTKMKALNKKQIFRCQNGYSISIQGKNIPNPINEFIELKQRFNINDQIINNLKSCGYKTPTPVQTEIIPIMLNGGQVLVCAPTGSGKTAAFLVPIIAKLGNPSRKGFRVLILCPTRELAAQIYRECVLLANGTGIKAHCIKKVSLDNKKFGPNFSKKFDILITTPNRLIYLMKKEIPVVSFSRVEWLIMDESDKLFEAGIRSFREQLAEIYKCCNENTKKAMFSATFTTPVAKWCYKNISNVISVTVGRRNTTVEDVKQELIYVGNENGKLIAFRDLITKGLSLPALVFVKSKEKAKQLFNELIFDNINVDVIHAERTQLQRDNIVKAFRKGTVWILICTELMGRGVDFKGVKLVINYDVPPSAISYIHQIGRTGRAGRPGEAVTFFTDVDKPMLATISRVIKESGGTVPEYLLTLKNKKSNKKSQNILTITNEAVS